jgi:hypothetical protein
MDGNQQPSARAVVSLIVITAAAVMLTWAASTSLISVNLVSEAAAQSYFENTQTSGLPQFVLSAQVRHDVSHRALRREGSDAVAIGLIGSPPLGDWPYYGYGDYYGKGDYYTPDVSGCHRRLPCHD